MPNGLLVRENAVLLADGRWLSTFVGFEVKWTRLRVGRFVSYQEFPAGSGHVRPRKNVAPKERERARFAELSAKLRADGDARTADAIDAALAARDDDDAEDAWPPGVWRRFRHADGRRLALRVVDGRQYEVEVVDADGDATVRTRAGTPADAAQAAEAAVADGFVAD